MLFRIPVVNIALNVKLQFLADAECVFVEQHQNNFHIMAFQVICNSFTGNSTTFFNEGKRQVGLELLSRITELGIDAVKLKQKAELEYIDHQLRARELAVEHTENQEGSK